MQSRLKRCSNSGGTNSRMTSSITFLASKAFSGSRTRGTTQGISGFCFLYLAFPFVPTALSLILFLHPWLSNVSFSWPITIILPKIGDFFLGGGLYLVVLRPTPNSALRDNSWQGSRYPYGCQGLNPCQPCARQVPCPLHYHSIPRFLVTLIRFSSHINSIDNNINSPKSQTSPCSQSLFLPRTATLHPDPRFRKKCL